MQVLGFFNSSLSGKVAGTVLLGGAVYLSLRYLNRYWRNRKIQSITQEQTQEQTQNTTQEPNQQESQETTQETTQETLTENN